MGKFTDNEQREWTLSIGVPVVKAIREECDPDFLRADFDKPREPSTMERLLADAPTLCNVVWLLCRENAAQRGIDESSFYAALTGDAIDRATDALVEAIAEFSPARHRAKIDALMESDRIRQTAMIQAFEKLSSPEVIADRMEKFTARLDELVGPSRS